MTKKNITFIGIGITIIAILCFSFEMYGSAKGVKQHSEKNEKKLVDQITLKSLQEKKKITDGLWVNSKDSLAIVKIKGHKWTFAYTGKIIDSTDVYDYQIVNKVKDHNRILKGEFLLLTKQSDTLKYALDYLTENSLTLIYLPRGNFHHYKRMK